jgi:hypothetical protein
MALSNTTQQEETLRACSPSHYDSRLLIHASIALEPEARIPLPGQSADPFSSARHALVMKFRLWSFEPAIGVGHKVIVRLRCARRHPYAAAVGAFHDRV